MKNLFITKIKQLKMKKIILLVLVALATSHTYSQCACCAGAGIGSSNGDYNNGILTLKKKQFVVETYADYRKIKDGDAIEEEEKLLRSMLINSLGARYGITDKITVSALMPYVTLNTNSGNDKGFGDLILMGTFNVLSKNNLNLALQGGIELPTGIQKNSNFDNSTVVVGSGSYDPIVGVLVSKNWDRITLQANGLYKITTLGFQQNYYGSLGVQNVSVSYNLKKGSAFCSTANLDQKEVADFGVNIFGGYYGEWLDKLKEADVVDENTGYYLGFANLGTNLSYKKWSLPITFSLPIITDMNGNQNQAGYRLRLGLIRTF
jgi:hypothetical protein